MQPAPAEVRAELEKVLASPSFSTAARLARFLRFVCERALEGDGASLKEYTIATQVYDRADTFDPRQDAIVRVEAGRLRSRLLEYYATTGVEDSVVIRLPKGSYTPTFELREQPSAAAPPPSPASRRKFLYVGAGLAAVAGAVVYWRPWSGGSEPVVRSIAVLPFVSLSVDKPNEMFADGLTEDITADLARIPELKVPGRTAMMQYKLKPVAVDKIVNEHKVDAVLEGSVRHDGNRIRVTAQLISARDGYHLWAETYDREGSDWLSLQRELSRAIASEIEARFTRRTDWRRAGRGRASADLLAKYTEARQLLARDPSTMTWKGDRPPHLQQALTLLEEVTAADPEFALGWSALAAVAEYSSEFDRPRARELTEQAARAAERALALDGTIAESHHVLATIKFFRDLDLPAAERHLARSIELNPRQVVPQREYIDILRLTGRREQAWDAIRRARSFEPNSAVLLTQEGLLWLEAGRLEDAERAARQALAAQADYTTAHWLIGLCLEQRGQLPEAESKFREVLAVRPRDGRCIPALGHVLAKQGKRAQAMPILAQLREQLDRGRAVQYSLALVHAGLGETEAAVDWLEKAYAARDSSIAYLYVEPRFRPLREHPRFQALVNRLNIAMLVR